MSCDIHMLAEIQTPQGWELFNHPKFHNDTIYCHSEDDQEGEPIYSPFSAIPDLRHAEYEFFSSLAGVRNSEGYNTLSAWLGETGLRGFPKDCSQSCRDWLADWGDDAHSMHFYLLDEIHRAIDEGYLKQKNPLWLFLEKQGIAEEEIIRRWGDCDYNQTLGPFYEPMLESLDPICKTFCAGDRTKVRILFFFDN